MALYSFLNGSTKCEQVQVLTEPDSFLVGRNFMALLWYWKR
jgi:hypothetical protein